MVIPGRRRSHPRITLYALSGARRHDDMVSAHGVITRLGGRGSGTREGCRGRRVPNRRVPRRLNPLVVIEPHVSDTILRSETSV